MYPPELVAPMKEDLTTVGFQELITAEDVNQAIEKEGTTFVVLTPYADAQQEMRDQLR